MKRYRVINVDLDSRASTFKIEIQDFWEPRVKELHKQNKEKTRQELVAEFGSAFAEAKIQNLVDLGDAPFSILAFHNKFLHQIRNAFVIGAYYPALTGACSLGERILNHLLLNLREFYSSEPEYKKVYRKSSFDNWQLAIDTLEAWQILLPQSVAKYRELAEIRNRSIHFDPNTDKNDRPLALEAIRILSNIIQEQFSGFGNQPWFIPKIRGAGFIKKEAEELPFVKIVYLPNSVLVGPYYTIEPQVTDFGIIMVVRDEHNYEAKEISDEEFTELYMNKKAM